MIRKPTFTKRKNLVTIAKPPLITRQMFEGKTLLTIAETAEFLNCSSGFVRKRIALTESNNPGGWPRDIYVNLQPTGAKSLYRINKEALQKYLNGVGSSATVENEASVSAEAVADF